MKNIIIISAIILIGLVGWFVFDKSTTKETKNEPIKIGAIYALSGPAAKFGEISAQGVRDAITYFKETTGQEAEVVFEDSANDPKQGVSAATKLFTIDKIKFVVIGTSGVSAAVAPIAEQNQSLLISDAALLGLTKDKKYTLQNFMPSLSDIPSQINNHPEWKKVAIIYINDEFGNVQKDDITKSLQKETISQTFSFEKTATDYRTDALKIKQFQPDVLVVVGYGPALNQVFTDLHVSKLEAPIISYLACTLPGVVTDNRFSLEGDYSYEYPLISNKSVKTWIVENGGQDNAFYNAAFENTLLVLNASAKTNGDPTKAIEYLKNKKTEGLWGDVKFNSDGVVNRDLILTKINNSTCTPVTN